MKRYALRQTSVSQLAIDFALRHSVMREVTDAAKAITGARKGAPSKDVKPLAAKRAGMKAMMFTSAQGHTSANSSARQSVAIGYASCKSMMAIASMTAETIDALRLVNSVRTSVQSRIIST